MLPLRRLLFLLPVLLVMSAGSSAAQGLPPVVITGEPVAPSPDVPGTGLCSASSRSDNPAVDFPQSSAVFNGGINTFLETKASSRVTSVQRTPLDLSNNNSAGSQASYGDFRGAVLGCPSGGCGFFTNDTTTSFATRLRGLLHVPSDKVGKTLHFGLYADDAVSLTLFDRMGTRYEVINRPPQLGNPSWRTTNSVTFSKPGLYPIEVLYAEVSEDAALELSMLEGTFTDFERPANQPPIVSLEAAGFELVTPGMFYLSESGRPSHPEPDRCVQCNRQHVNAPGGNGCDPGYHCNAAALCSPCDSAAFCGASCSPCVPPDACHVGVCDVTGTCSFPVAGDGTTCPGGTCQAGVCRPDASTPDGGGSGSDGGSTGPDGGSTGPDGGSAPDASTPDAGGGGTDAGSSTPGDDGGTTGGGPDGGTTSDAGTAPGGGDENPNPDDGAGGCGCGTGARSLAPLCLLGLALLLRRVRRPRFE
jgi:outer membrane exchange protein TraA